MAGDLQERSKGVTRPKRSAGKFQGLKVGCLLFLICTGGAQDIAKLNDGVLFQKVKSGPSMHSNWHHLFAFEIPTELIDMNIADVLASKTDGSLVNRTYADCIQFIDRELYPQDRNVSERWGIDYREEEDSLKLCKSLRSRLEVAIHGIQKIYAQLRTVQGEIHALLPPRLKSKQEEEMEKWKRGGGPRV